MANYDPNLLKPFTKTSLKTRRTVAAPVAPAPAVKPFDAVLTEVAALAGEGSEIVAKVRALPAGPNRVRAARTLLRGLRQREMVPQDAPVKPASRRRKATPPPATVEDLTAAVEILNHGPVTKAEPLVVYENGRTYKVKMAGTGYEVWTVFDNGTFQLEGSGAVSMDYGAAVVEVGPLASAPQPAEEDEVQVSPEEPVIVITEAEATGPEIVITEAEAQSEPVRAEAPVAASKAGRVSRKATSAAEAMSGRSHVLGYGTAPLIRWMSSQGWSVADVSAVLASAGVQMGERSIYHRHLEGRVNRVRGGVAGTQRPKAAPTAEVIRELEARRAQAAH